MVKQSAGILVYQLRGGVPEVLLVHPAGPFWAKKDTWSIPKGETDENEELMAAAKREFMEEVGIEPPAGPYHDLGISKQGSVKINYIWTAKGDLDISKFECNSMFTMEWPPKSGIQQSFPENDRASWFGLSEARQKVYQAQRVFMDRLAEYLGVSVIEDKVDDLPENQKPQQTALL